MGRHLTNQTIAITGASSGIGQATALACAQAGMDVALCARREDKLDEIAKQIKQLGRQAFVQKVDVDDANQVQGFIDSSFEHFGQLDSVLANAGYGLYASIADCTDAQARAIFDTNFFGTLHTLRPAAALMKKQGHGHLLVMSSAVSEIGLPMYGLYCATKAAQDAVASAMRAELADENIFVSSIHPVGTRTDFYETTRVRSNESQAHFNTPSSLTQTAQKVAKSIVKCLRKPRPEVWPQAPTRFGIALVTAFPSLNASSMRSLMRKRYPKSHSHETT